MRVKIFYEYSENLKLYLGVWQDLRKLILEKVKKKGFFSKKDVLSL